MKMSELYAKHLEGKTFKSISEWHLNPVICHDPSELAANSPILQKIIAKHTTATANGNEKYRLDAFLS